MIEALAQGKSSSIWRFSPATENGIISNEMIIGDSFYGSNNKMWDNKCKMYL